MENRGKDPVVAMLELVADGTGGTMGRKLVQAKEYQSLG
jgi:hypothetical protein